MRGSPLLRAAFVVAALLLLLVPLRSLTRAVSAVPPPPQRPAAEARTVELGLIATAASTRFSITHLGRVIWSGEVSEVPATTNVKLSWPAEGVDLGLEASWPGGKAGAVKLTVTPADDDAQERTAWGDGSVQEIFTYR